MSQVEIIEENINPKFKEFCNKLKGLLEEYNITFIGTVGSGSLSETDLNQMSFAPFNNHEYCEQLLFSAFVQNPIFLKLSIEAIRAAANHIEKHGTMSEEEFIDSILDTNLTLRNKE